MPLPEWLEPMAATLTDERFHDPAWTFERKLDGIRVLAYKNGRDVDLWSRNRLSLTTSYPEVAAAIAALPVTSAIFDGEATGAWGRQGEADYHVFDVLWHWVRPEIVVQVAFAEWTVHGKLRHPRLLALRIDKSARDVVREWP